MQHLKFTSLLCPFHIIFLLKRQLPLQTIKYSSFKNLPSICYWQSSRLSTKLTTNRIKVIIISFIWQKKSMRTQMNREIFKMLCPRMLSQFYVGIHQKCYTTHTQTHSLILVLFYGRIIKTVYNTLLFGWWRGGCKRKKKPQTRSTLQCTDVCVALARPVKIVSFACVS